jgi:hypothetical protein
VDYSNKAGAGREAGVAKLDRVSEQFQHLHEHIPYLQANFIFGLDTDEGNEPIELTKEFMTRAPFAWPALNIPVPYGGTPLHDQLRQEGRILESMPFSFYYAPYLVMRLKHYDPVTYYEKLIQLFEHCCSLQMLKQRMTSTTRPTVRLIHLTRTASTRAWINVYAASCEGCGQTPSFGRSTRGSRRRCPSSITVFTNRCWVRTQSSYPGRTACRCWTTRASYGRVPREDGVTVGLRPSRLRLPVADGGEQTLRETGLETGLSS